MTMGKQIDSPTGQAPTECASLGLNAHRGRHRPDDAAESSIDAWSSWRTRRAEQFDAVDVSTMRCLLAKTVLFGQPKWRDAVGGDVASAVGVAVSYLPIDEVTVQFDIAMTALVAYAIEGDNAAAIVLSNILRNLPGSRPLHRRIATSWLVSNLAALTVGPRKFKSTPFRDAAAPAIAVEGLERSTRTGSAGKSPKLPQTARAQASASSRSKKLTLHPFCEPEDVS